MRPFALDQGQSLAQTSDATRQGSVVIAGGTTLVDLMKLDVMTPGRVIDINSLPLGGIAFGPNGLSIGAVERMADVAEHADVVKNYPVISQALLKSASPQLRNMASIGGNLMQRTRCGYFRDVHVSCNKRVPGSGCPALDVENRMHAILGTSDHCCATHPSDLAVALVALGASILLQSDQGTREVKLEDFYLLPGTTPDKEHDLRPGELITRVQVPPLDWARKSLYLKIRDRASYEFALVSVAVALQLDGDVIHDARLAVGGVGTKPWSLPRVREAMIGQPVKRDTFEAAAKFAADGAKPLKNNAFKVTLLQRTVVRAFMNLGGLV